ncbi:hypothetical protein [Clostridium sp. CCUG 7971]|uniref:hypothetical protein n=1 Tax=Clostridium sp. CCUG 7971 TaxID=2811414 RepID=UPI001ABA96C9|nr:hypothetical protein [Clostridium sp. CCUG 7971]MBO3445264.1 hypothetical protein [Clostridium sp. CCUG 7971]
MINILIGLGFIDRGTRLKKTKNIKRYAFDSPEKVNDKDGYINLISKAYFLTGIISIIFGLIIALDKFIFEIPLEIAISVAVIFIIFIFSEVIIIKKKRYKFIQ